MIVFLFTSLFALSDIFSCYKERQNNNNNKNNIDSSQQQLEKRQI
jgi:hypothetical protein